MFIKKTESYALITISVLIFLSFIIGFIFNENSAGAGGYNGDFGNYIWPNLNLLKENIFENLTSLKYTDSRTPIPYVFHILLNPFIDSQTQFRISVFFISLLCPIFFFLNLKLKYKNINNSIILLISSLIMMSPYFRTSAFWGLHENYGILSILISYFFFQKYLIFNKNIKFYIFNLFVL